ncbi:MAG: signal peptidase I [Spirochaetales bacterium]|nr:signal peptidase I [Spirochaetales bacterium]
MIRGVETMRLRKKRKKNPFISGILKIIILTFFISIIVNQFLISPIRITSVSMFPAFGAGDIVMTSPLTYGPKIPFMSLRLKGLHEPERGDIVAVTPPFYSNNHFFAMMIESVIRFFSFQTASLIKDPDGKRISKYSIKRIIGLPGDSIKMKNFAAYIKPRDSIDFIIERDLIKRDYTIFINQDYFPDNWQDTFPFSGNMETITLQPDEYFVLGDNRTESNDSYSWGPLPFSRVAGKIIFQYWPFKRFGIR